MTHDQAGMAALHAVLDQQEQFRQLLALLAQAETSTTYTAADADGNHAHVTLNGNARASLHELQLQADGVADRLRGLLFGGEPEPPSIERAARKYAGLATTGEAGAAAHYDHPVRA